MAVALLSTRPISTGEILWHRAFTLIEVLVVIGIILLLIGILIPAVAKVRKTAQAVNTQALISALDDACQIYYQDHHDWPGPLRDDQLGEIPTVTNVSVRAGAAYVGDGTDLDNISGTENLVLGLLGGLVMDGGKVIYDPALVGDGPVRLGHTPGGYRTYFDAQPADLSMYDGGAGKTGSFVDDSSPALDSIIPEFIDRFNSPMPILYMRAQPTGFNKTFAGDQIAQVFNYNHIGGYIAPTFINGGTRAYIGVGKGPNETFYLDGMALDADTSPAVPPYHHGLTRMADLGDATAAELRASMEKGSASYTYPFDFRAALLSPTIAEARQKDRYVLISAGADRIYGTRDDLTNFGGY